MISNDFLRRQEFCIGFFIVGVLLSVTACGLLAVHASSFSLKRDTAVMIGTTLPELRSAVALLSANSQAEQLFAQNALSAREEQAAAYILPEGPAASRAVEALRTIASTLAQSMETEGVLERLAFDQNIVHHGSYKTVRGELHLKGDFRFVARFLTILSFSGDMMIRDALTDSESREFLRRIETLAPLTLRIAEDFLYTDLLQYAASPDQIEQILFKELPVDAQADIKTLLLTSGLAAVRTSFQHIALSLNARRVWPLPLLRVNALTRDGEQWIIDLTFYRR